MNIPTHLLPKEFLNQQQQEDHNYNHNNNNTNTNTNSNLNHNQEIEQIQSQENYSNTNNRINHSLQSKQFQHFQNLQPQMDNNIKRSNNIQQQSNQSPIKNSYTSQQQSQYQQYPQSNHQYFKQSQSQSQSNINLHSNNQYPTNPTNRQYSQFEDQNQQQNSNYSTIGNKQWVDTSNQHRSLDPQFYNQNSNSEDYFQHHHLQQRQQQQPQQHQNIPQQTQMMNYQRTTTASDRNNQPPFSTQQPVPPTQQQSNFNVQAFNDQSTNHSNHSASSLTYENGNNKVIPKSNTVPYPLANNIPEHPEFFQSQPKSFQQLPQQQSQPPYPQQYPQQIPQHTPQTSSQHTSQQFQQQPLPSTRKPFRRAPSSNLSTIQTDQVYNNEGRRTFSSPHQQTIPGQLNPENRTKSLSSTSARYKSQHQQQQQPAPPQSSFEQPQSNNNNSRPLSGGNSGSSTSLHHTFSLSSKSRSFTSISKLSSLSTKKFGSSSSISKNDKTSSSSLKTLIPSNSVNNNNHNHNYNYPKSSVYPAMLSEVAKLFKEAIILTINTKDGLEYHDTFTGKMAVDILCRIIKTNDRNLALLLGRSLDAQKFFHDVTYNHRLRDSVHEVYSFNNVYNDVVEFYHENEGSNSNGNNSTTPSAHGSFVDGFQLQQALQDNFLSQQLPSQVNQPHSAELQNSGVQANRLSGGGNPTITTVAGKKLTASQQTGVNGVFTILTDCYSPTCSRNRLCYSIACPRRLEQQARLNLKPQGGLKRAVSRLSLHDQEENETLWHKTVPQSVLDKLDKHEKTRQELIYEFIYTERDYVKDLEFMTDFYIMPLRNPINNIIPEHQRETFIQTVFGGVGDLLRLSKNFSDALTKRQQQQKPVIESIGDIFLDHVGNFEPFIRYSGNKVFATFEHERQQQVNMKYSRFLDAIEKKPESRRQDLSSFLIKGVQRPARYQLLLAGILKHTKPESPDYKNLLKSKEEIESLLVKINVQTGESTDRHKIMVLHRLLGKQTLENKFNFKLSYNNRIIYQVTLNRKRDNEKIDLYLFEHALLLVKHKIQNKREQHKVFEKPILLPLLFVNSGIEIPNTKTLLNHRYNGSLVSDIGLKNQRTESNNYIGNTLSSSSTGKFQINFLGLGSNQVHSSLFAEDLTIQNQVLQQISQQQKKLIDSNDLFSMSKFETRRFQGNNKINCAVPCYGGKKLLYGTDSGVWVSTVRSISTTSNEKICSDPTLVISKPYITQIEVLVEYSKLLILSDKSLYEFDLSCTDSLDHIKNTKSGKIIMSHITFFKIGICDSKLLIIGAKTGSQHSISIFEPINPFDQKQLKQRNKNKIEIQEIPFTSDPISISFLKSKLCIGCTKGFEILSLQAGNKEPILDEADPSLDFATQREIVTPLAIHRLGKDFLLCYSEFVFLINRNGWRTNHDWGIFWEGNPQNVALFFPYLISFEPGFIEIRDLHTTNLLRSLIGENIRYLHSNEHEAMFACEENGFDIIISIDFLNLKPKSK